MASPSVTYTFSNSTTADGTQVNTNFTDIINGLTDGSKDLSISALTCAGTATLNGNINLGNASGDDLTITASLASTLAIKTTFTYDIGSTTIGLRALYLGDAGSAARATKVQSATIAAGYTLTLPTSSGTAGYGVKNLGSGSLAFLPDSSTEKSNLSITASVAASALTIALKGADGNDPSATNPVYVSFRNATSATGTPSLVAGVAAASVVISSGSTLGHRSAVSQDIYVYLINNAGTIEVAASSSFWDEGTITTTTAEGAAGAADSNAVIYSTSARSNIAIRLIGRLKSTQATAGTWATAISEIALTPFVMGPVVCGVTGNAASASSGNPVIFPTITYDSHSGYNTTTGRYTVPTAGYYRVHGFLSSGNTGVTTSTYVNASLVCSNGITESVTGDCSFTSTVLCAAGDIIDIRPGATLDVGASSTMFIERVA